MENSFASKFSKAFNLELPYEASLDEYLKVILPAIKHHSEDLNETEFFLEKPWKEFKDDENFQESVLHIFNSGDEYLESIDGNVHKGKWRTMSGNKMLIDHYSGNNIMKSELFDLAYLDDQFFILKKHGDQQRKQMPRYFLMAFEPEFKNFEWREVIEKLFDVYRNRNSYYRNLLILIVVIALVILFFSFA